MALNPHPIPVVPLGACSGILWSPGFLSWSRIARRCNGWQHVESTRIMCPLPLLLLRSSHQTRVGPLTSIWDRLRPTCNWLRGISTLVPVLPGCISQKKPNWMHFPEKAKAVLHVPTDLNFRVVLSFGYPVSQEKPPSPKKHGRKPFDEVVRCERWL